MLTKEHLRFRTRAGKVFPQLAGTREQDIAAVRQLTGVFSGSVGQSEEQIRRDLQPHILSGPPFLAGVAKLLLDACKFHQLESLESLREEVFVTASALRRQRLMPRFEEYEERLSFELDRPLADVREQLFGDLPECRKLVQFVAPAPDDTLAKYNLAQVQGLVARSRRMELSFEDISGPEKRALLRAVRFNRLVADQIRSTGMSLHMRVEGPLAVLSQHQNYGMRLASFFTWVVACKRWAMQCEVFPRTKDRGKGFQLHLDQNTSLRSNVTLKGTYVPDEYRLLLDSFSEESGWCGSVSDQALDIGDGVILFPDMTFSDQQGKKLHLQLYHRWHFGRIAEVLEILDRKYRDDLIIGVCRSVGRDSKVGSKVRDSKWFSSRGFWFTDFPTSRAVRRLLKGSESAC